MNHSKINRSIASLIALAIIAALMIPTVGCVGSGPKFASDWKAPWSKKDKKPEPYPNPAKMAVTWTPDTLVQSGRTPTRGFGGRLFFYDEKIRAVPVEGELTVHAFAENPDGSVGEVKRYHFTSEQFTQHFSQSDLGASYSIWIPWDAVGGDQMRVSLVPSFRSAKGNLVQGETALVGLPGKRREVESIAKRPDPNATLMAARDPSKSGLTTTTIPLRRGIEGTPATRPGMTIPAASVALSSPATATPAESQVATQTPPQPQVATARDTRKLPSSNFPERRPQRLGQNVVPASAQFPVE